MKELTLVNLNFLRDGNLVDGKIRICGGIIEQLGTFSGAPGGEKDCGGLIALPALVDNHVHFREPGAEEKEGFASGSAAASHGGAGTVIEIQNSLPLLTTPELVRAKKKIVARKSKVNVGFYSSAVPETLPHFDEMASLTAGFKLFMAPTHADSGAEGDDSLRPYFQQCARLGSLLIVHAEDGRIIREASKGLNPDKPVDFCRSRPPAAEISAVERALRLAEECGTRLHIFHVTTAGAVDLIDDAKKKGLDVTASTCPHYLFFTDDDVRERGALLKVYPSIKSEQDQKRLFEALKNGIIEIVSTDHAPHKPEEKSLPFGRVPAGISSSDLFLPLMTTLMARRRFTLEEIVALCSRNPARIHGLLNAGRLEKGWAADIVLVDPAAAWTVEQDDFLSRAFQSPYVGMELRGRVAATIVGGKPVYVDGTGPLKDVFHSV